MLDEVVIQRFGCAVERMNDRKTQAPARLEHSGGLGHGARQIVHVVQ
jgi:hypothetical protein